LRQRGDVRGPPELRDVARADGAVAVPVCVGVVAELAERRADGALGEGGVGLVDPAVAVDVLRGEVAGLAVGVVCDAEGEGARPADGGDDAELVIREVLLPVDVARGGLGEVRGAGAGVVRVDAAEDEVVDVAEAPDVLDDAVDGDGVGGGGDPRVDMLLINSR
jgi:hypothetical protein